MSALEKVADGFRLIEGPVWSPDSGLWFADAEGGGVFELDKDGSITTVVEHRRGIGGLVRHQHGGVVVSGRNVAYKDGDSPTIVLLDNLSEVSGMVGFSDMCADSEGRVLAGMLGKRPTETDRLSDRGSLWLIDLDGSARCVIPDPQIEHTNGLAFAPGGTCLYYADSAKRAVLAFDYDVADGSISKPQIFATLEQGIPDGIAVAEDGAVWVANAFAARVLVYAADGSLQRSINVPQEVVTNVCFGGPSMNDVFITTGSLDPTERVGAVYRTRTDVQGLAIHEARCSITLGRTPPMVTSQTFP